MAIVVHTANKATTTAASGGTSTLALNVRNVSNRFLLVQVAYRHTGGASGVVWRNQTSGSGDQSLVKIGGISHDNGQNLNVELWGLIAPTTSVDAGAQIRVTHASGVSGQCVMLATCLYGVHQTTPYDGYPTSTQMAAQAALTTSPRIAAGVQGVSSAAGVMGAALTLTTNGVGDLGILAIASDEAATTANFKCTSADAVELMQGQLISGSASNNVRAGMAIATHASSITSGWTTYVGGSTTNYSVVQSGRNYVQGGVTLKPATESTPYSILGPMEPVGFGATTLAGARFITLADFPTAGSLYQYGGGASTGPNEVAAAAQLAFQYSVRSATAFSTVTGGVGSVAVGTMFRYNSSRGNAAGSSQTILIPSGVAEGDIMIVNAYTEPNTVACTQASFTEIFNQTTASARQTILYKRLAAADGDLTGTKTYSFTTTAATWRTLGVAYYRGCITSRTPYINSTDDAGDTALPQATTGTTGTTVTSAGVTTSDPNQTVVTLCAAFNNLPWTVPFGGPQEREEFYNTLIADQPCPTTGTATGAQVFSMSNTGSQWMTYTLTLISQGQAVNTNHTLGPSTPSAGNGPTALAPSVLAGRKVVHGRSASGISVTALSWLATRKIGYKRAPRTPLTPVTALQWVDSLNIDRGFVRTANGINVTALSWLATRKVNYGRAVITLVLPDWTDQGNPGLNVQSAAATNHVLSPRTPSVANGPTAIAPSMLAARKVVYKRAAANATTTVSFLAARKLTMPRSASGISVTTLSWTATRKAVYKRAPTTSVSPIWVPASVSATNPLAAGWTDYGAFPIYLKVDDWSLVYPGCSFYLEVQMESQTAGQKVYARLYNVTDGAAVGAMIETSAPHTTTQILRSAALSLNNAKTYKVQFNKGSAAQMLARYGRLVVRDVA